MLLIIFYGFSALSCSQADPCTICPDVSGSYALVADAVSADKSTCGEMYFTGMQRTVTIRQDESHLHMVEFNVTGTLLEDSSVSFESWDLVLQPTGERALARLSGMFVFDPDGPTIFRGNLSVSSTVDHCRLTSRVEGNRI